MATKPATKKPAAKKAAVKKPAVKKAAPRKEPKFTAAENNLLAAAEKQFTAAAKTVSNLLNKLK